MSTRGSTTRAASLGGATPAFQRAFPDLFVRDTLGQLVSVDLRPVNLAYERERKLRVTIDAQMTLGKAPPPPPPPAPGGDAAAAKAAPPPPPPKPRPPPSGCRRRPTTGWRTS